MPAPQRNRAALRFARGARLLALCAALAACGRDRPAEEAAPPLPPSAGEVPATGGSVYEVRVRSAPGAGAAPFEPAQLTARRGDVIRFVLADSGAARGVSFPEEGNPAGATLPVPSPLMRRPGQVYEIPVDFPPGSYTFVALPPSPGAAPGRLTVVE